MFCLALIGAILALGLQLLVGMAGLLSLGQAAFYGIGAYVSAALTLHFGVPFLLAFVLAGVAAALSSLLLVPIVRLQGSSLAVATLGFNIIIYLVLLNEDGLTGGSFGMMNVPAPSMFGYTLTGERAMYFVCLMVGVSSIWRWIASSFAVRPRIEGDVAGRRRRPRLRNLDQPLQEQMLPGGGVHRRASPAHSTPIRRAISIPTISPSTSRSKS